MGDTIEKITAYIPGTSQSTDLAQAEETLRISVVLAKEIELAREACQSITEINGVPVMITGLHFEGRTSVDVIGITYIANGQKHTTSYKKEEFYNL